LVAAKFASSYSVPEEDLQAVQIHSSERSRSCQCELIRGGRIFVGGREALFQFDPDEQGAYRDRLELIRYQDLSPMPAGLVKTPEEQCDMKSTNPKDRRHAFYKVCASADFSDWTRPVVSIPRNLRHQGPSQCLANKSGAVIFLTDKIIGVLQASIYYAWPAAFALISAHDCLTLSPTVGV
jgi:hypothetical protein